MYCAQLVATGNFVMCIRCSLLNEDETQVPNQCQKARINATDTPKLLVAFPRLRITGNIFNLLCPVSLFPALWAYGYTV